MFGQASNTGTGGGGLFGGQSTNAGTSSLFGQPAANQQNNNASSTTGGGGLFGASTQSTGTGLGSSLFPAAGQQQNNQQSTTGAFGQPAQNQQSGGLFGQSQNQSTAGGGGLFGQPNQNQNQNQNQQTNTNTSLGGSTLFGSSTQSKPALGGSLFGGGLGQSTQNSQTNQTQQNGGGAKLSLFGGGSSLMVPTGGQGGQGGPQSSIPTSAIPPSAGAAGAYFDSLFAKTQKGGETNTKVEDLPSLELGLGDLRNRLRKLQSKPNEKPLDGKAHYLLAAAGVDPGAAAKDLGMLDAPGGRAERASQGYAPSEVDVETYLANLQSKTTLSMIADGLERSVRDFDNFLEDHVTMEWEAQRKRIYQHFGIKPREETGRESQGAFGRSRRSKAQGSMGRTGGNNMLGRSSLHRSIIGTPTRIGNHQTEFADVERSSENGGPRNMMDDRATRERQTKLSDKVRMLNESRLMQHPYPIFSELADLAKKSNEPHAPHVVEAYYAMMEVAGEDPDAQTTINNATAKERAFAKMYLDENPNSSNAVQMRKRILHGSTKFLESQFLREVESLIAKHPQDARPGGLPDVTSKIKAYIRLRSARKDLVPENTELQQVQGEYVWAIVFYLLRSGHVNEAAKYVNDNTNQFRGIDRTFATYLNAYAASADRRITQHKLLERCTAEYMHRKREARNESIDPFRMACYKVIGRVELNNRHLENLNSDINDWIWLQFNLAREGDKAVEMAGDSYGLAEVQASIKEIGHKHFPKSKVEDTNNGSFGMFFYLQVLSGLFEDAVFYLYQFNYVDAVHFALSLTYYGLLRASDPVTAPNDLRTYNTKSQTQINFGRMLGYYTRDFRAADVMSAVDYLALICLNADLEGEAGRRHAGLCHEALRELVLETREFSKLIGDIRPDGRLVRGIIEERGALIGLDAEDDFVNTVTLQAASFADESGRTTDSVLLYHLAGEYDMVVSIVSRALSEAISLEIGEDPMRLLPVKPRAGDEGAPPQGSSLSLAAIDDPVELANTMMSMYERDAMFFRKIQDQNKLACRVLLEMSTIKRLVEAGQWAQCLDKIRGLDILPLDARGDPSAIRAYASRFSSLSQPVSINVPNLLMWTVMSCVRQREVLTNGQFSGNEGTRRMMVEQLKQMTLDLTTYTSQLRYRFPPHLLEALAKASAE